MTIKPITLIAAIGSSPTVLKRFSLSGVKKILPATVHSHPGLSHETPGIKSNNTNKNGGSGSSVNVQPE